jgi:hypothetical protein
VSGAQSLVRSLFTAPGQPFSEVDAMRRRAASAHADLLGRAMSRAELGRRLAPIDAYLHGSASRARKRRLLCHPLFVEGLHALSPFSAELQQWHDRVTSCAEHSPVDPAAVDSLGNVALAILLRIDPNWCGRCELCTDILGRIGFPFCDWTFLLCSAVGAPLAGKAVSLTLDHDRACWRLGDGLDHPFLVMPRSDCVRMLLDRDACVDGKKLTFPDASVRLKLTCASRLGRSTVRYDPIAFPAGTDHAAVAGGLIARIVAAIRRDSPSIYREFRTYIETVRGFEFPRAAAVASFSDPTLPGVMGVSVAYSDAGEPCLDPFCFTWFGHEMGHTKNYLCDTVLFTRGECLATNCREWSTSIARYGRQLAVRTLLQVPYVHLYEWELLMDFFESNFRGLPWRIEGGTAAIGDDLAAEIEESFDHLDHWADLTPTGVKAVDHFHALFEKSKHRWRTMRVAV